MTKIYTEEEVILLLQKFNWSVEIDMRKVDFDKWIDKNVKKLQHDKV